MSAIFYSVSAYSETVQRIFLINPVYVYIKYFRTVVMENQIPSLEINALALIYALSALGIGALIYKKCNHKFLYYV
jgi:ABC-2 type transport system permease protein